MPTTTRPGVLDSMLDGVTDLVRRPVQSLLDALTAPHGTQSYVELVNPAWARHEVRATVRSIVRETPETVTLVLQPNANWQGFQPGQFVELSLVVDGVRHTRCYSPSSSPSDRHIELTARIHPDGTVSPRLATALQPGDVITLSQAQGTFTLQHPLPAHLLMVCAGTGITPLLSMLRTLAEDGHRGRITFVQYGADGDAMLAREVLAALSLRLRNLAVHFISTDRPASDDAVGGVFTSAHLTTLVDDLGACEAYACGPPALLDGLTDAFAAAGYGDHLHVERFTPPPVPENLAADAAGTVVFVRSSRQADSAGETLLTLAEANGLTPAYGCRMGICHTCTTTMHHGAVRDIRTGRVCSQPGSRIQPCVSIPLADTEVDL